MLEEDMEKFTVDDLKKLYLPPKGSHKGENGKLTIIGGSKLFHGASLWALKVASRICDMVFYASVAENNEIAQKLKSELYDFICVPREEMEQYIKESDAILIGPGMVRSEASQVQSSKFKVQSLETILHLDDEGEQTYFLTKYLLQKYPEKKWVIDAGSLQMMEPEWLNKNCLITPHQGEFEQLFCHSDRAQRVEESSEARLRPRSLARRIGGARDDKERKDDVLRMVKKYDCTILLKGKTDIIGGFEEIGGIEGENVTIKICEGGNSGMTKGGTGDVLAGLAAALACKNDLFMAACASSLINKKAGEELFKKVGYYFNASDLCEEIPRCLFAGIVRR